MEINGTMSEHNIFGETKKKLLNTVYEDNLLNITAIYKWINRLN